MLGLGRPQSGWASDMGQGTGASTPLQELQLPLAAPSYSKKLDKEKKTVEKKNMIPHLLLHTYFVVLTYKISINPVTSSCRTQIA